MRRNNKEIAYTSYTEFIEHTHANRASSLARFALNTDRTWYHDVSYEHSLSLARKGWKDGRATAKAFLSKLDFASRVHKPEIRFDVVGDCGFDMGRYLNGEPECMMTWSPEPNSQKAHIVVDVAASAGIDAAVLVKRGAAVVALIEALEAARVIVEVTAIFYDPNYPCIKVPIKQAGKTTQKDQIIYAIAHPAFMRRFCHLALGHGIMPTKHNNPKQAFGADIYIPPMDLRAINWKDDVAVVKWIAAFLKVYNVSLNK